MKTVFIVDTWKDNSRENKEHTYKIVSTLSKAKTLAYEYMKLSYKDVGEENYTETDFEEENINNNWIDYEAEFGVNIYEATEEGDQ